MKVLEESKIWALWGLLTLSYSLIIFMLGNIDPEPQPFVGLSIILKCALWNFFCLHFLFDYSRRKNV